METSQSHSLRSLRELLETAFRVEDPRGLFSFAMHAGLRAVADQFQRKSGLNRIGGVMQ